MDEVTSLFKEYISRSAEILKHMGEGQVARLIALENQMVDNSGLPEGARLRLRAYMEEYRTQKTMGYESGADAPGIPKGKTGDGSSASQVG